VLAISLQDKFSEYDFNGLSENYQKDIKWIVYDYQRSSYEGAGFALVCWKDGKIDLFNLSHCSCYGPTEKAPYESWNSWEEILKDSGDVTFSVPRDIWKRVLELVNSK